MIAEPRYQWSKLSTFQLGRYAEHLATLRFLEAGLEVYSSEVDDRGIDLLVRIGPGRCLEVQVKSVRNVATYTYIRKELIGATAENVAARLSSGFVVCFLVFTDGREPDFYLFPGNVWIAPSPPFVSRDYVGLASKPEFGISVTKSTLPDLERYQFPNKLLSEIFESVTKAE